MSTMHCTKEELWQSEWRCEATIPWVGGCGGAAVGTLVIDTTTVKCSKEGHKQEMCNRLMSEEPQNTISTSFRLLYVGPAPSCISACTRLRRWKPRIFKFWTEEGSQPSTSLTSRLGEKKKLYEFFFEHFHLLFTALNNIFMSS